jgi:hypothetical protein
MATDPALRFPTPAARRALWPVPTFLVGAAVLIAVPLSRAYWHPDDAPAFARQLAHARQSLEKSPPDWADVIQRAQIVVEAANRFPQFAAEAHFLIGSAQLGRIEHGRVDPGVISQARQHLQQAEQLGVSDADRPKLAYRLARSAVLLGLNPSQAALDLAKAIDAADDPADAYGLLAEAFLKQQPPDLAAALEATKKQLEKAAPATEPRLLAQARLRSGKLHLAQNAVKDGRQALERIGNDARQDAPDAFFTARALLAESYESTQDWGKAARNWEQVRSNPKLSAAARAHALFRLGSCYWHDQRAGEATTVWEEAAAVPGDEGQAARLRLAELRTESAPDAAVEAFTTALRDIREPADYRNRLISLNEVRQMLERAAAICRTHGHTAAATKLIELFARLAPPGRDDEILAEAADAAADSLAKDARQLPDQSAPLHEKARGQYLVAARAYERAAGKIGPGPEQARWLWKSADRYLKAQQQQAALDVLMRMTQLEDVLGSVNTAEAWFEIATIHHQKQQYAAARSAYQNCLKAPGRFGFRARHQLAILDLAENRFDEAEMALQENRSALRVAAQPDLQLLEQTEFALAAVAFQRQNAVKPELREYTTAEQRYLGALQQFPDSPEAVVARFNRGQCFWFVAMQKSEALSGGALKDDERKAYLKQYRESLHSAAEQFDKVEEDLLTRQKSEPLPSREYALLRQAAFMAAHCFWHLENIDEALRRYSGLALRYQGQVWELGALSQVFQCHRLARQDDKAKAMLPRIRDAFEKLPESAFTGSDRSFQRSFWLQWLTDAEKVLGEGNKPVSPP